MAAKLTVGELAVVHVGGVGPRRWRCRCDAGEQGIRCPLRCMGFVYESADQMDAMGWVCRRCARRCGCGETSSLGICRGVAFRPRQRLATVGHHDRNEYLVGTGDVVLMRAACRILCAYGWLRPKRCVAGGGACAGGDVRGLGDGCRGGGRVRSAKPVVQVFQEALTPGEPAVGSR